MYEGELYYADYEKFYSESWKHVMHGSMFCCANGVRNVQKKILPTKGTGRIRGVCEKKEKIMRLLLMFQCGFCRCYRRTEMELGGSGAIEY